MNAFRILFCAAALVFTTVGYAQGLNNMANSNQTTNSTSGAMNAGVNAGVTLNSTSNDRLKTVPSMGGNSYYGSFSSDNCFNSVGGSAAWMGFGASAVAPVEGKSCVALRAYERLQQGAQVEQDPLAQKAIRQAAYDTLCQASDIVRKAMSKNGLCSPEFADDNMKTASTKEGIGGASPRFHVASAQDIRPSAARQDIEAFYSNTGN